MPPCYLGYRYHGAQRPVSDQRHTPRVPSDTGEEKPVNDDSIRWAGVRRLTFVPFLHDGRCAGPGR
jgi:hypothetical protein